MTTPTVFISYSWDSDEHRAWVRRLAVDLQENGVHTLLDQWDVNPGMNLQQYMESAISSSHHVLLVCTPPFASKANQGSGGVGYEKGIVTGEMFTNADDDAKFIPILRNGVPSDALPIFMKSRVFLDFTEKTAYTESLENLLRHIHKAPRFTRPTLGSPPSFGTPASWDSDAPTSVAPAPAAVPDRSMEYMDFAINQRVYRLQLPQWWGSVEAEMPEELPDGDFRDYVTRTCGQDTGTTETWRAAYKLWVQHEARSSNPFPVYPAHCLVVGNEYLAAARWFSDLQVLADLTDSAAWYRTYLAYNAGKAYFNADQPALAEMWFSFAASGITSTDNVINHYAELAHKNLLAIRNMSSTDDLRE